MTARTVVDVVLGEAVSGTRAQRYEDMRAIASVIANRSARLDVSPQEVVASRREFNAYGKALPKGANAYRDLAEAAIRDVFENGPIHTGTFYATPSATRNLPKGLSRVTQTTGHVYFDDPKDRAIGTAVGYRAPDRSRQPTLSAYAPAASRAPAQKAIEGLLSSGRIPTPTPAPRGMFSSPPAERGSRVAAAPANVPTPTARPSTTSALPSGFDQQRFGGNVIQNAMPRDQKDRLAQAYGVPGSRVAPQSVGIGRQGLTKAQEANLADRLGTFDTVQPSMASVGARTVAPPTARPTNTMTAAQEKNLSDRLGTFTETRQVQPSAAERITRTALGMFSTPAAAATRTPTTTPAQAPAARTVTASPAPAATPPARTNFAGPAGSPRSVDGRLNAELRSVNPMVSQAPRVATPTARPAASLLGVTPAAAATPARPTTNFAGPVGSPRAVEGRQINAARQTALASVPMPTAAPRAGLFSSAPVPSAAPRAPVQSRPVATPVAAPRVATPMPAPTVSVAPAARRAAAPQAVAQVARTVAPTPTARPEPQQPSPIAGRVGTIGGSLIGSAIAGPIGGLVGGFLGNKVATSGAFSGGLGGGMFSGNGMNGMGANSVGMNVIRRATLRLTHN